MWRHFGIARPVRAVRGIFVAVLVPAWTVSLQADSDDGRRARAHPWWVAAGAGYVNSAKSGISAGVWTSHLWGIQQATLRAAFTHVIPIYGGESEPPFDIGLLYGLCLSPAALRNDARKPDPNRWNVQASLSAGIAAVNYGYVQEQQAGAMNTVVDENFRAWTWGIPLQADLTLIPRRAMGFGLSLLGNWNEHKPFWGAWLGIRFGKLR